MLRRTKEEDIRSVKTQTEQTSDQSLHQISKYRNNVLATLRDPSYERRAGAMRTLKIVLTNWVNELAGQSKPDDTKPGLPNGDAAEFAEAENGRPQLVLQRPSFNRGGSFRMGFEDVFDGDHDASPVRSRTTGEDRISVPPTPPSPLSSRNPSGDLEKQAKHWNSLAHPTNPPPTAEAAMYRQLKETPYCTIFDSELSELLRGGKEKTPGDIAKFPPHGTAERDFLSDEEVRQHLVQFYLGLLRCIGDYPWRDVRKGAKELIKLIETTDVDLPRLHFSGVHAPSLFIPVTDTVGLRSSPSLSLKGELPMSPVLPGSTGTTPNSSLGIDFGDEDENNRIVEDYFALSFSKQSDHLGINMPAWSHRVPDSPQMSRKRGPYAPNSLAAKGQKKSLGNSSFPSNSLPVHLQSYPRATSPLATSSGNRRKSKTAASAKPKFPSKAALDLYLDLFRSYGRITNVYKVLSFCPRFARARTDLIGHVNQREYSIPMEQRIYLGIMAAAEMKCQYYLSLLQYDYLQIRGNPEWLEGLHKAPLKFQKLAELNTCLAQKPWNIPSQLIKECLAARWNEGDLILAIMILSFYHTQSAFVMSCGIIPEVDLPGGTVKKGAQRDYAAFQVTGEMLANPYGESTSHTIFENDTEDASHSLQAIVKPTTVSLLTMDRIRAKRGSNSVTQNHEDLDQNNQTPVQEPFLVQSPENSGLDDHIQSHANRPRAMSSVYGNPKRRQSFVDCAKSDGPIFVKDFAASWSAPGSYIPASSVAAFAGVSVAKDIKRDGVTSPYSSFSSVTQASSVKSIDFWTRNVPAMNFEKFLPDPKATTTIQEEDVESAEDYFLDMADFDWSGDCCSIIGNHFTGFDSVLDKYFRIAEHASSENGEPCFAEVVKATKRRLGPLSRVGSLGQISDSRRSLDFSSLDLGHKASVSFDLPHVSIDSGAIGSSTGLGIGSDIGTNMTNSSGSFEFSVHDLHRLDSTSPTPPFTPGHSRRTSLNVPLPEPGYPVKEAIWSYSLRLLGIQKADYHYSDIKLLLSKSTRRFIKRISFAPHQASQADWLGIEGDADGDEGVSMCVGISAASASGSVSRGSPASVEEKVLIAVLATQARFMGQIMLGIKAVEDSRFA